MSSFPDEFVTGLASLRKDGFIVCALFIQRLPEIGAQLLGRRLFIIVSVTKICQGIQYYHIDSFEEVFTLP